MVVQFPQWAASVATVAQLVPHSIVPAEQVVVHWPLSQTSAPAQALPQPPQLLALLVGFTHVVPHIIRPEEQAGPGTPPVPDPVLPPLPLPGATLPTQPAATQTRIPARAASLESFMDRNPLLNCR
jgi:hypothetical protein